MPTSAATWAPARTFLQSSTSATGSYLTLGLSCVHGPAITPRVADTLTFTATWGLYF